MSFAPPENELKPRDVLSEMHAREMMDQDVESPSVDFLGPLMRRKSIVILFCLIGSVVGYLLYRQELPTYQSGLRVMIWKKSPPSIVNGDKIEQGVSISKEQTLISSQEVLDSAIERGKLNELETFRGNPAPFYALTKMVSVKPTPNATDTLDLTCRGPIADELPGILNAIVDSYQRSLKDEREVNAQDSIALIERLHQQLVESKEDAKKRYYFLMEKLNLSADNESQELKNPFLERQKQLEQERYERSRQLLQVTERLKSLSEASKLEGNLRLETLQSLSIEAEKYLNLGSLAANGGSTMTNDTADRYVQIRKVQDRLERNTQDIEQIQLRRKINSRTFGDLHPSLDRLKLELESLLTLKETLEQELVRLKSEVASEASADNENQKLAQNNAGVNESSIRIYAVTLQREQNQHKQAIAVLDTEYKNMEANAQVIRQEMAELNLLKNEIKEKEASERDTMDRLSEFTVVASNFSTMRVRVINQAQKGIVVAPILRNYLLFSLLIGGLLGSGIAILIDRADLTFRNPYEIFQRMKVPVICKIPTIAKSKAKNNFGCVPTLITAIDPRSAASEAFRACRTALMFFGNHSGAKVYLLSSPSAGDGKSTAVANLGVSIAQGGKRVVILDADMRRPRQHKYFGISMKPGMINFADGDSTLDEIIRPTFQENLSMVTCGGHPANPGEFVVSQKFKDILQGLRDRFDIVLIDSPPLLPVADATSLSTQVDGVLLVFRIRKGIVLASQKARELLDLVHARMLGILVNGVDQNPYYNEYGGYGYPSQAGYYASRYYEKQTKEYSEASESS